MALVDPAAVCCSLFPGLDEGLVEYISGGVVEDNVLLSRADLVGFVAPMLEEFCEGDEEKAEQLAGQLWEALRAGEGGDTGALSVAAEESAAPVTRTLQGQVSLADGSWEEDAGGGTKACGGKAEVAVKLDPAKTAKLKAQKEREAAKAAEKREKDIKIVTEEMRSLNLELEVAREQAAREKAVHGSLSMGALEVGPFQLPNPGGGADLLEDASCVLVPGHRYGLIGRNGKGKSTLLRWLAARRVEGFSSSLSVFYTHQEVTLTSEQELWTPAELVLHADVERRLLLTEAAELAQAEGESSEKAERITQIEQRLEAIGSAAAPERVAALLKNLGFRPDMLQKPMSALSGGWRVRSALACALFALPDVLLLDEPTNHLSIDAVMWLTRELSTNQAWDSRVIVVVSHDRFFLDDACTDMLHISGVARRLTQSRGSYSVWAERREEKQKATQRQADLRDAKAEKLRSYTQHGFKYGGSSGQINMQQKKLKELHKLETEGEETAEELADLQEDEELPLRLEAGGLLDKPAIQMQGVGFTYSAGGQGPMLFQGAELNINSKSRVVLLGENGAGKTTLVKLMQGELSPSVGLVQRAAGSRVLTVNQHHASQLDLDQSPLQFMASQFPGNGSLEHEGVLRGHLAGCGVGSLLQSNMIRSLSGGQRSRVAMAAVSFARPHVLILDEPTNNLDLEAVAALADCVEAFEGGVVLVSHDNYFVSRVAKEVWVVADGAIKKVESFQAYKKRLLSILNKKT